MKSTKNEKKTARTKPYHNDNVKNDKQTIRNSFAFTLVLGIVLILVSLIINNIFSDFSVCGKSPDRLLFLMDIIIELIKNIGIAVVIASLFSFVSSTKAFIDFIRDRLISIIITKEFLSKVSNNERKEMVRKLLSSSDKPVYPGINDYFNKHISQSLSLFETYYRSSCQLYANAKIDESKKIVRVDTELRYRMYKVSGNFENFNIGFEDELVENEPAVIYTPDGKKKTAIMRIMKKEEIAEKNINSNFKNDASLVKESFAEEDEELNRFLNKYNFLDIVNKYSEFGNDHWHLFTLRITRPCDKLSIYLSCDNDLVIKKYIPFGEPNSFNSECRDGNRIIDIFCNEWLEAGLGVAILIAKKDVQIQ